MLSLHSLLTAVVVVIAPGTGAICAQAIGPGQGRRAAVAALTAVAAAAAASGCTLGVSPQGSAARPGTRA